MAKIIKKQNLKMFLNGNRKLLKEEFRKFINDSYSGKAVAITTEYICSSDNHGQVELKHFYFIKVKHYNKKHYVGCRITFLSTKKGKKLLGATNFDLFDVPNIKGRIDYLYEIDLQFTSAKKEFLFTGMGAEDFDIKHLKKEFDNEIGIR